MLNKSQHYLELMNKHVKVFWNITNYCTGGCSYCPSKFWGGDKPESIETYLIVARRIVDHYARLDRAIHWNFDGGELLEFFDFPELLKICKTENSTMYLKTAGGKMWLNWWAVEPYIDHLDLTYHYWQNPNLVRFIIQIFQSKNKTLNISVPIRHDFFEQDCRRASDLEQEHGIYVNKTPLYIQADTFGGLYPYTKEQQEILFGKEWVENNFREVPLTFVEKQDLAVANNPSFTGQLCNLGIETIRISHDGWLNGSNCNNGQYGNIFKSFELPVEPQVCKMISCINGADQQITKFLL